MKKIAIACFAVAATGASPAFAQDWMSQNFIKGGDETFVLNLGGIVNQFGSSLTLNGPNAAGSNIDLERAGLPKSESSFDAAATWRFWSRNRIDVLYFSAKRSGSRTIDGEVTIDGVVIPVNSTVAIVAKDQFLNVDYRYSFMKSDEVELAGLIGIYAAQYKYQITATRPLAGGDQETLVNTTASTTVPLPLIGATVDWYVNPRWKIFASAAGIKAKIGDVDGSAFVGSVTTDFMLARNFGVGLGYMYSDTRADVTKGGFNGNVAWKINSISLYAQAKF